MNEQYPIITRAGLVAALLGTAAGLTEVAVGTAPWLGDKNQPTTLGFVTVFLALIIGTAAWAWRWATTTPRALAVAASMLLPALLGLTTAGAAWLPAGAAAILGGTAGLRYGVEPRSVPHALSEYWSPILLGCLALIYLALGITAGGLTGVLAVMGSIAIAAMLSIRRRSRAIAVVILILGALPFGILAWSSVVPPLTTILTLAVGVPLALTSTPRPHIPTGTRIDTASTSSASLA